VESVHEVLCQASSAIREASADVIWPPNAKRYSGKVYFLAEQACARNKLACSSVFDDGKLGGKRMVTTHETMDSLDVESGNLFFLGLAKRVACAIRDALSIGWIRPAQDQTVSNVLDQGSFGFGI